MPNEPTAIEEPLDKFLIDVVRTLMTASARGLAVVDKDPATADKALHDCKEILDVIMAGHVQEWIAA